MPHLALLPFLWTALQTPAAATRAAARQPGARPPVSVEALPNDNRQAAGRLEAGVLRLRLEARIAAWRPNGNAVDTAVTVQAFAETGSTPRIPGPLLRGAAGTAVVATVHNALDSTLVLHGLRAGTTASDTLQIPAGATREVRFRLGAPGTYMYWGTTTNSPVHDRPWRDSQLTGAIVVDPPGVPPDTTERIFVITVLDLYPQDTLRNKAKEDVFDRAINGRSWPHGERLAYTVGDTVRWRWINGSYLPHPMHLHGFHFRVTARGEGNVDSTYAPGAERTVVTEFMVAGSTFRMQWVPTRAGNWLMHGHMRPHVVPFPERPDSVRAHDAHDSDALERHPLDAMQGLVLGVTVVDRPGAAASAAPAIAQRLRVLAQQAPSRKGRRAVPKGYVLQRGAEPVPDSVEVPGSPLVLVRGETTAITVVNRLRAATTVHWHGMELESVYDGVSGWSRTAGSIAPLIAPGDSFTVTMTPPRAGTFIYHTHMDEEDQLATGLYGPLLVVEPGDRWDPATDLVFMLGTAVERDTVRFAINGRAAPPPRELRAGTTYRLRFVNIHAAAPAMVELLADSTPLAWRPRAKDGADLPVAARAERPARLRRFGVGETWDFEWTPERPMDATLVVHMENVVLRQPLHVRAPVIDMHLHAHSLADYGGGGPVCGNAGALEFPAVDPRNGISPASELATCPRSSLLQPAATDEALMRESIAMLERYDIVLAMTTGRLDRVSAWRAAAPDRIRPATYFNPPSTRTPGELRRLVALDSVAAFAEISAQYEGMTLDDPRLEPFFALAEELDVPVGVHLGEGPAGGPHTLGGSPYRARLGSPFQLEEVLTRHPRLRVWVMHYGSPLVDEMIAVLYSHPQVYVDVAQNDWGFPRAHFYGQLRRLVDAGFAKRILWGSDQMIWPGAIRLAIETIEQAPFLTDAQKRDILYNNAARFLRLSPDEIAKHHGRTLRRGDP